MHWDEGPNAGFTTGTPWLPILPDHRQRNIARQRTDPDSIWSFWRTALHTRRREPVVSHGEQSRVEQVAKSVLGWRRSLGDQAIGIWANMSHRTRTIPVDLKTIGDRILSSHPDVLNAEGRLILRPYEGICLRLQ